MRKRPQGFVKSAAPIDSHQTVHTLVAQPILAVKDVEGWLQDWLIDGEFRQQSPSTLREKRAVVLKFASYLNQLGVAEFGAVECRQYLIHISQGGAQTGGRWGQAPTPHLVRPRTVFNHWSYLRTFFNWLVAEGYFPTSPFARIKAPIARSDQIRPLSEDQIMALLQAARRSKNPRRDVAIIH